MFFIFTSFNTNRIENKSKFTLTDRQLFKLAIGYRVSRRAIVLYLVVSRTSLNYSVQFTRKMDLSKLTPTEFLRNKDFYEQFINDNYDLVCGFNL